MSDELAAKLRAATEDDVQEVIDDGLYNGEAPADLLEFFNRMLDVLGVPDADGDIYERPE